MSTITVRVSIQIAATPERVWDFTQDYSKRMLWDRSIRSATIIRADPPRLVQIKGTAGLSTLLQYKKEERPYQTSLRMTEVKSPLIAGGGGSWRYIANEGGTEWIQTNSIILKDGICFRLVRPIVAARFRRATRRAMERARQLILA